MLSKLWHMSFLCRNIVDPHGVILNISDQLVHGARRPFNNCTNAQTHRRALEPAIGHVLHVSPQAQVSSPSRLGHFKSPPVEPRPGTDSSVKRAGEGLWICPTCLTLLEESLVMSHSVCLSSCIHRSVTYCRPPGRGQQWVGSSFWWMYSSQWTAAIYNLISKIIYTVVFFFVFLCSIFITHLLNFDIVPTWQQRLHVILRIINGAQTHSRFCLFAVVYFIIIRFFFSLLWEIRWRMKIIILKNTADEWVEWNGDLYGLD